VRIEVDLVEEEGGIFRATAVSFAAVTVTGRTEKEALSLLVQAMEKHMKGEARKVVSDS